MDGAEAAVVLLKSAAETAKETADDCAPGRLVGVLSPNVLRLSRPRVSARSFAA